MARLQSSGKPRICGKLDYACLDIRLDHGTTEE